MLIPRFSLRALLAATAVCAVLSLVLAGAVRGQAWAIGLVAGLSSLVALVALHPLAYAVAAVMASMRRQLAPPPKGASPFATAGPPRQVVPPKAPPE